MTSRAGPATTDTNIVVTALLRDLAAVQRSTQSRWGYRRAAAAVFDLEGPIEAYVEADGTLRKIPGVGPKSEQVIHDVLKTGGSPTVEHTIAASDKANDVEKARRFRTNFLSRARVVETLRDASLDGPAVSDYRGDLQMHSIWSDGVQTLEEIIAAGVSRGYAYCALTDHSYGLRIARGVSMADLATQHRDIDRLNREHSGTFRLIKGIEANIGADGSIDMTSEELARVELVVVAAHSALRSDKDQTARMLAAVETPGVHILGHPRGRMYGTRAGVVADWSEIFAAAARSGVAIEIDGDPARQDIDYELARVALVHGCLFALDSDAHATDQLRYAETAIAHARLAGIPADRIINYWPLDRLLDWLSARRP